MIPAVGAVVLREDGRVLLVRRRNPPLAGEWSLVGGRIEANESAAEAAVREVREETGIDVEVIEEVAVVDVAPYRIHEFLCVPRGNVDVVAADDALDARWATDEEVSLSGVRQAARDVIRAARMALTRRRSPHPALPR